MHLETDRLLIRDFEIKDADALFQLKYDKRILEFLPGLIKRDAGIDDIKEAIQYFVSVKDTGNYEHEVLYAVVRKECNTIIGALSISDHPFLYETQVGWMIRQEFCQRGYASEAANAFTEHLFSTHHYDYVIAIMDVDNPASYHTALKSGFKLFEKRTVYDYKYGRYGDDYYYFRKFNPKSATKYRFYGDLEYDGRHS